MKKILEKDIQLCICDYFALKKYFFWRQNTIPAVDYKGGKMIFRPMPKYSLRGVPDIILIDKGGKIIFIEVKRPGGKLSEAQIEFKKMCDKVGATYMVAYSLDDIIKAGL